MNFQIMADIITKNDKKFNMMILGDQAQENLFIEEDDDSVPSLMKDDDDNVGSNML